MAGNRKYIMKIKQIITLKTKGWSNIKMARELSISRNTINEYARFFEGQNLDYQTFSFINTALYSPNSFSNPLETTVTPVSIVF